MEDLRTKRIILTRVRYKTLAIPAFSWASRARSSSYHAYTIALSKTLF